MKTNKLKSKVEYGDFQTPLFLAAKVVNLIKELGCEPSSVLEPTCGLGSFITASLRKFPSIKKIVGRDVNKNYIETLSEKFKNDPRVDVSVSDFFETNWDEILEGLPPSLLIVGNPPWVTNAALSTFDSQNLPKKNNLKKHSGIDAITGSSNFDISEWMLLKMFEWTRAQKAVVAMLVKTTVARKVLLNEWKSYSDAGKAKLFEIDAFSDFGVSVDACLLVYDFTSLGEKECEVYKNLSISSQAACFGYEDRQLIANVALYKKTKPFQRVTKNKNFRWRSGIKHDASKVMELKRTANGYTNNLGEIVDIEDDFVFPMMKSSDLANNTDIHRFMLVTQHAIGEETKHIRSLAPKTWGYLIQHRKYFEKRKSSIYKNKPPFSIFGVGSYSFSQWKVAISGLYKKLYFQVVAPYEGKPVVLDDTCYFLACDHENEARAIAILLNSQTAIDFFSSFIFWDSKRPITAKVLNKLSITSLAKQLQANDVISAKQYQSYLATPQQLALLEQQTDYRKDVG